MRLQASGARESQEQGAVNRERSNSSECPALDLSVNAFQCTYKQGTLRREA